MPRKTKCPGKTNVLRKLNVFAKTIVNVLRRLNVPWRQMSPGRQKLNITGRVKSPDKTKRPNKTKCPDKIKCSEKTKWPIKPKGKATGLTGPNNKGPRGTLCSRAHEELATPLGTTLKSRVRADNYTWLSAEAEVREMFLNASAVFQGYIWSRWFHWVEANCRYLRLLISVSGHLEGISVCVCVQSRHCLYGAR